MSRLVAVTFFATFLAGSVAAANVPRVAADIAPVHSLVSRVMQGVGTPDLIIAPGASPHEYSLRPSEARALSEADLVFWVGEDLTPWMENAISTLAAGADVTALLDLEGVEKLPFRDAAIFGDDGHDHVEGHDHAEGHSKEAEHEHDHDHDHGEVDAHAWLSPANALVWLDAIAMRLSAADPDNAAVYEANAEAGKDELRALSTEVDAILEPVRGRPFVVFHDAYQYFERSFDIPSAGAISISDATDPSPARIAALQEEVARIGVVCVLAEPQFNRALVDTVGDGLQVRSAVLDPLGVGIEPGPELYPTLIRDLATALAGCLRT